MSCCKIKTNFRVFVTTVSGLLFPDGDTGDIAGSIVMSICEF